MDRPAALLCALGGLVLVAGYVTLAALGRPTDGYLVFVSGPLITTIVGSIISRKVGAVQTTADSVQQATNGSLTRRLDSLDRQLGAARDVQQAQWHPSAGSPPPAPAGPRSV